MPPDGCLGRHRCRGHPSAPPGAPPGNIYGVTIEYWENVEVPTTSRIDPGAVAGRKAKAEGETVETLERHHGDGAAAHHLQPLGPDRAGWTSAVARRRTPCGPSTSRVGFRDNPGVTPLPDKHIKRILRFRIVVKDASVPAGDPRHPGHRDRRHDKYPVSMTYVDSLARRSGSGVPPTVKVGAADLPPTPGSAGHDVTAAVLAAGVPPVALAQLTSGRSSGSSSRHGDGLQQQGGRRDQVCDARRPERTRPARTTGTREWAPKKYKTVRRLLRDRWDERASLPAHRDDVLPVAAGGGLLVAIKEGSRSGGCTSRQTLPRTRGCWPGCTAVVCRAADRER